MDKITIEKMNLSNLSPLLSSIASDFDDFWTESIWKSELVNASSHYWMAKQGEEIVGIAGIQLIMDEAHITNIVTKKSHRKNGIATLLLEKMIQEAKNLNCNLLTLEVKDNNIPAIHLYQKFHFQELGKRKQYYHTKEDAIIMTLFFSKDT